jgi:hypothetical protein
MVGAGDCNSRLDLLGYYDSSDLLGNQRPTWQLSTWPLSNGQLSNLLLSVSIHHYYLGMATMDSDLA